MKLAYIEWVDSKGGGHWEMLEDIKADQAVFVQSVGWIWKEDKERLILLSTMGHGEKTGEVNQALGYLIIPKSAITKKMILPDPTVDV